MKLRLFKPATIREVEYKHINSCPLCDGFGTARGWITRSHYQFGPFSIPLPRGGVGLTACIHCDLLFKTRVPTEESLTAVLSEAASDYWQEKTGRHPHADLVGEHLKGGALLDIGASNGDLLRDSKGKRLSALDAVPYEICKRRVTGEYIISPFEKSAWSGQPYDVVTAFDVFEHFMSTRDAVANIVSFLAPGGSLVVETGDWHSVRKPHRWYYTNLFEHQIFWSRRTFEFFAKGYGLAITECRSVFHKGKLSWSPVKAQAVRGMRFAGYLPGVKRLCHAATGIDPSLLPPPAIKDHLLVVMHKSAQAAQAA